MVYAPRIVEAAGVLLGIQRTSDDDDPDGSVYRGVPPVSIYGATLRALTQQPTECLERLRSLDLTTVDDQTAHEVFAKTLQRSFAEAGGTFVAGSSPSLAPPWENASVIDGTGRGFIDRLDTPVKSNFADSLEDSFDDGGALMHTSSEVPKDSAGDVDGSRREEVLALGDNGHDGIASNAGHPRSATHTRQGAKNKGASGGQGNSTVAAAVHTLKTAVLNVTRRLEANNDRLPLRNRTTAVLVDGSRMSLMALELAGAAWKFGRFVIVHVSGESATLSISELVRGNDGGSSNASKHSQKQGAVKSREGRREEGVRGDVIVSQEPVDRRGSHGDGGEAGRWRPGFLREELRQICLRQLEIPNEALRLDFRTLPEGSRGCTEDVTDVIDTILKEHHVEVVFMGCYGRRGPRVTHFGRVAQWAMEKTPHQVVFAKQFSPSMVSPDFFARPKRYLVAVSADLDKVSRMLDNFLPLVSPHDSVVLIHILDESVEDIIAGETMDEEQIQNDLASLLANKRGLCHRVRVEKTGHPPEHPTQTVVQRIVKVAGEEAADFLAILHDESRGSYRTVATGCLREARCSLVAVHI